MSSEFHTLRIAEVVKEGENAISILFDMPNHLQDSFAFQPGQHLTMRTEIDGEELRRNYSLCAAPHERQWKVAIKRLPGGRFSGWANEHLESDDSIDVMPPTGSFTWKFDPGRTASYAFFASGSGITPILSLLKTGLVTEPDSRFALFYGNKDSDSILFLEVIADLKDRYLDRLKIQHFFSREEDELQILNGRIDDAKMKEVIANFLIPEELTSVFICGPEGMMDAVEKAFTTTGIPADRIHSERFTAKELSEEQKAEMAKLEQQAAGKTIKLTIDGRRRTIEFDPVKVSILENARASGVRAPFSCKAGVCATCRAKVVKGKVEMIRNFGLTPLEIADGYVLTCQSVPVSDDVEVDFDL